MYLLAVLFFAFIWWFLWYLAVKLGFFLGKRFHFLAPEKSYKWVMRIIVLFLFFTPTYGSLITSVYRHITFPILCEEMAGYQKLNPVSSASFLTNPGMIEFLAFKGVDFIEWEISHKYQKESEDQPLLNQGLYRVEYFPEGNLACDLYKEAYPDSKLRHRRVENMQKLKSRTKQIAGMCIGVTKITELKAEYQYLMDTILSQNTRYEFDIMKNEQQIIDRITKEKVLFYVQLVTGWDGPFSFMLEGQRKGIRCPEKNLIYWDIFAKFLIIND